MAVFDNTARDDVFRGTRAEYDQVDYQGHLEDYVFTRNADGSVTVSHPTLGTDTLWSIEGLWFHGERQWYSVDDAIGLSAQASGDGYVDAFGTLTGGVGDDRLVGTEGEEDVFYGARGDDTFIGGGDEYDQVEYDGEMREYTFVENADGSVTVSHPTWGTDTLVDIDGMWFVREQAWYSLDDAVSLTADLPEFRLDADNVWNGTPGDDVMRADAGGWNFYGGTGDDRFIGREDAYDQVNYDGGFEDFTFTRQVNGTVVAEHPVWGRDVLVDIDGVYFAGKNEWMSVDALTGPQQGPISEVIEDIGLFA